MDKYCIVDICYYPCCCYCAIWGHGMKNQSSDLNSIIENAISVMVQGDGRHPNDVFVVIHLKALTGINFLMGRPL